MKKAKAVFLGLVVLLAFGCGKDDDGGTPNPLTSQRCQLTEMRSVFSGGDTSVQIYTYNAAKQITKIISLLNGEERGSVIPEYNAAGKISKTTLFQNNLLLRYYTYEYNTDRQLIKHNYFYDNDGSGPEPIALNAYRTFEYNAAKKRIKWSYFNAVTNTLGSYSNFTYPTASTAVREGYSVSSAGTVKYENTSNYTFDDKKAPELLLHGLSDPDLISENNLLELVTVGSSSEKFTCTYQYNADGFPISQDYNKGGVITTYTYNCQ